MTSRLIYITGANRGIGFCIAQAIGTRSPDDTILVGSRTLANAEDAIERLKKDASLRCPLHAVEMDVTDGETVEKARDWIEQTFGRLDVLINNAGVAQIPNTSSWTAYRSSYQATFETNITAVGWLCTAFDPLLRKSSAPKVINVSSGRASMSRSANKQIPPTAVVPYSISKVALNALTLELIKGEQARNEHGNIEFFAANPGHCRTAFNGFRGKKDPLDGAMVVAELALAENGAYEPGFWEHEDGRMGQVPW